MTPVPHAAQNALVGPHALIYWGNGSFYGAGALSNGLLGYTYIQNTWAAAGVPTTISETWPSDLSNLKVLLLANPTTTLSDSQLGDIRTILAGGGTLVISDEGANTTADNAALAGLQSSLHLGEIRGPIVTTATVSGLTRFSTGIPTGSTDICLFHPGTVTGGVSVIEYPVGTPVVAAEEHGGGTILVGDDADVFLNTAYTFWGPACAANFRQLHLNIISPYLAVSQMIQFTSNPPSPAVQGATYAVSATGGGSGNPILFSTSTPDVCSVTGAEVSLRRSGTCTVTADQAGGPGYLPAPQATQTFIVLADQTPPSVGARIVGTLGQNGWYVSDVTVTWSVDDPESGIASLLGCAATTVSADTQNMILTCVAVNGVGLRTLRSVTIKRDATAPTVAYAGNLGSYTISQSVAITCAASDATAGIATTTCADVVGPAYSFRLGTHIYSATAIDLAGNAASAATTFQVIVTTSSLCELTKRFVSSSGIANSLCAKLNAADASMQRGDTQSRNGEIDAYVNEITAQTGKAVSDANARILVGFARVL